MKKIFPRLGRLVTLAVAYTVMAFIILFTVILPIYMNLMWPD